MGGVLASDAAWRSARDDAAMAVDHVLQLSSDSSPKIGSASVSRAARFGLRKRAGRGSRVRRSTPAGETAPGSRSPCRCRAPSSAAFTRSRPARARRTGCRCACALRLRRAASRVASARRRRTARDSARRSAGAPPSTTRGAAPSRAAPPPAARRCGSCRRRCDGSTARSAPCVAQQPHACGQRVVVGRDEPGVAERAEVLAREEREAPERADRHRPGGRRTRRRSPARRLR